MKRNHSPKELDQLQKTKKENEKLKRQLSSLRKQLARLDLDRYSQVKEVIEQHYQEDREHEGQEILDKLKQEWKCHECDGFLEIFCYNKVETTWYYRLCSNAPQCKNRTASQKYSPDVKGIIKGSLPEK